MMPEEFNTPSPMIPRLVPIELIVPPCIIDFIKYGTVIDKQIEINAFLDKIRKEPGTEAIAYLTFLSHQTFIKQRSSKLFLQIQQNM